MQWYCRIFDEEMGPLSFADLVRLVRDGTLGEDDPVREADKQKWISARDVTGLFAAARVKHAEPAPAAAAEQSPDSAGHAESFFKKGGSHSIASRRDRRFSRRLVMILAGVLLGAAGGVLSHVTRPPVFPEPYGHRDPAGGQSPGAAPYTFPLLGEVSRLESWLLCFDTLLIAVIVVWALRLLLRRTLSRAGDGVPHGENHAVL